MLAELVGPQHRPGGQGSRLGKLRVSTRCLARVAMERERNASTAEPQEREGCI